MAVDKLVDSTQLDADLTSVANAIRTKGGTSASLAFPTDFVSAIAAIPSGGGGGDIESGSFTIEEDTLFVTLQHSLGVVPDFCIVYPINVPQASTTYRIAWEAILRDVGQQDYNISTNATARPAFHGMWAGVNYAQNVYSSATFDNWGTNGAGSATTTTFKVGALANAGMPSAGTLSAGTYGYVLGVIS